MDLQVDKDSHSADYVEFSFADQYLGRNEMWRLGKHLVDQCIFVDQDISFIGVIAAKVQGVYVKGQQVGLTALLQQPLCSPNVSRARCLRAM